MRLVETSLSLFRIVQYASSSTICRPLHSFHVDTEALDKDVRVFLSPVRRVTLPSSVASVEIFDHPLPSSILRLSPNTHDLHHSTRSPPSPSHSSFPDLPPRVPLPTEDRSLPLPCISLRLDRMRRGWRPSVSFGLFRFDPVSHHRSNPSDPGSTLSDLVGSRPPCSS